MGADHGDGIPRFPVLPQSKGKACGPISSQEILASWLHRSREVVPFTDFLETSISQLVSDGLDCMIGGRGCVDE